MLSGKTSLARRLAAELNVPHVELDALHHGPNWDQKLRGTSFVPW